ncbi:MAG: FprA family A-type flavoprotein [Candidatus Ranarchaeia archaeon]
MTAVELSKGVYWIGVNVRTDDNFEGMWPIPHGVSLNSYLVKGEKFAVIDLVREWKGSSFDFYRQIESTGNEVSELDYIILNHLEPDHTESLLSILRSAPNAKIVTTKKGAELIEVFYGITDRIQIVTSGDSLDLGGKTLVFEETPFVHWPETMVTYLAEDKILFSCDAFGSFGSLDGSIFDDEICDEKFDFLYKESLRYYANIVALFSPMVLKAIEKTKNLDIKTIAPSHGIIWRKKPETIVNRYIKFANYRNGIGLRPKITFIFGSMYGNTEAMGNAILRGISKVKGVDVDVFQVPNSNQDSYILSSAWESGGIIFGMPTYENKMYPPMVGTIDHMIRKGIKHRDVMRFGSWGWSGGAQREFDNMTKDQKWEVFESYEFRGGPTLDELRAGEKKGEEFAKLIKSKYS